MILSYHTVLIKANTSQEFAWAGTYFKCVSGAAFLVSFGASEEVVCVAGRGFQIPEGFKRLRLKNDTVADITISAYTGTVQVIDDPALVAISGTIPVNVQNATLATNATIVETLSNWIKLVVPVTAGAGTAGQLIVAQTLAKRAIIRVPAANVGTIDIGPSAAADFVTGLTAGSEYAIPESQLRKFDLAAWYFKPSTLNEKPDVIYVS